MVEEHHGMAYDAREEADWPIDALATSLKIAKAAKLKGSQLSI